MKPTPLNLLLNIAQNPGKKTTIQLAAELGVSQQTASRWLSQLQKEGMVEKTQAEYRLTQEANKTMATLKNATEKAAEAAGKTEIQGTVVKGLGEGAYYMSLDGYKKQIEKKLGFTPYPGTLNLRVTGKTDLENNRKLQAAEGVKINGFKSQGRFFGGAKCFKAKIIGRGEKANGAVIIPDRTHHDSATLEVIAPVFLRKKLGLKERATVKVTVDAEGTA
ncbi:MAG TPA: DUF120 domain-containing protein [Candidatus Norongarragalinales archaeon]|nr:DUF120 domain-containing protein [Candidatus Norongarragalinales archaeon]